MSFSAWSGLFAALSPAGARGRLSVFIFHRVLPQPDPLFPDEVHAAQFDKVCGWLARWFTVVPLHAAVAGLRQGSLPARAAAITFDDGYADNCEVAMPILQRHGLSATFFIATGFLNGGRMWNDTLIEAVRFCPTPELDLSTTPCQALGRLPVSDWGQRRQAVERLLAATKYLPVHERQACVDAVAAAAGVEPSRSLMMRDDQVRALRQGGMQVGAHTVSHPILATLPAEQALQEMVQSRQVLQDLLGEPVPMFAYPNGKPGQDYSARSVELAREAGFEAAVSTVPAMARAGTDLFQIPRFTPWDRQRHRFAARLARQYLA